MVDFYRQMQTIRPIVFNTAHDDFLDLRGDLLELWTCVRVAVQEKEETFACTHFPLGQIERPILLKLKIRGLQSKINKHQ